MDILFTFDAQNGFAALVLDSGIASYAYPTSPSAEAAQKNPQKIAREMLSRELSHAHMARVVEHSEYIIRKHFPQVIPA